MELTPRYRELMTPLPQQMPSCGLFLSSLLADAAYFHYDGPTYEAVRQYLGLDSLQWIQTPGDLTVNYVLGIAPEAVIVAFSGTENWRQLVTYCGVSFLKKDDISQFAFIHAGFRLIAKGAYDDLQQRLSPAQRRLPITLIGHSLGGAVAQILAFWQQFLLQQPVVQVITFGSPAVAGVEFNAALENVHKVMLRNDGDIIPFLPVGTGLIARLNVGLPILYWFFRYRRIQPQLVASSGNVFEYRNFPLAEKGWLGIFGAVQLLLGPFNPIPDESAQIVNDAFVQHSMVVYMAKIYNFLLSRGDVDDQQCLTPFIRALYDRLISLGLYPESPSRMTDAQFSTYLQGLHLPPSAISTLPNPNDVYTVFEAWLAGTRSDVTIKIGLFTNAIPATVPSPSYFVEPTFVGYRSFGAEVLTLKQATPGAQGHVRSGYLTWHVDSNGNSPDVIGLFVVLSIPSQSWVLAVEPFPASARLQMLGDCLSLYVDLWSMRRIFTPNPPQLVLADGSPAKTDTPAAKQDFGESSVSITFLPCGSSRTGANNVIFQDRWPPSGDIVLSTGGQGGARTWWLYRGDDRRMMQKTQEVLKAILLRDANRRVGTPAILGDAGSDEQNAALQMIDWLDFGLAVARQ
jgi:hypothetical protein